MKIWKSIKNRITKSRPTPSRRFYPSRQAGIYINHETALKFSAVFACVRFVGEGVAALPWHVFRREQDGGKKIALSHTLDRLLHLRPNPEMSAFAFKTTLYAWAQTWGNAYAEIEHDGPISPDRVEPRRDENGRLFYEISNQRGEKSVLKPEQVFHLAGMGFDGIRGYSIISLAATSIGAGMASDQFVASFYANGAVLSGALTHPKTLTDEGYERLKKDFKDQYTGSKNAWKPIILEDGTKWESLGMPLKDAEFLATQKYRITDIARWFRVPPHKIADLERATFTNIEHQAIEVVQDTFLPWTLRTEQEADYKLISPRNYAQYYTKMNLNAAMRGDHENRAKFYKAMREMGAMNTNEIRILEDLNPIGPAGDKYTIQAQYTTLEKVGEEATPVRRRTDRLPDEIDDEEVKARYGKIIDNAIGRICRRENMRTQDALKRIENSGEFERWVRSFMSEHASYIKNTLAPIVQAIIGPYLEGEKLHQSGNEIIDNFISHHTLCAETVILDLFKTDDGWDPWSKDDEKDLAEILVGQISNYLK